MDGFDIGLGLDSGLDSGLSSGRDAAGRFVAGVSGNPAGKLPGTRNRRTVLAEALRDGEGVAAARVVIDKALAGDGVAARFIVGLLTPRPRGRAIELDLPELTRPGDVIAAFDATLAAMAAGEITPDEALTVTRVLDGRRRALQALVLARRRDAEATQVPAAAAATATATDEDAPDRRDADDCAAAANDAPNGCEASDDPLHSACISPSPATMRGIVATLPVEERRVLAELIRQRRAAATVAAPNVA
jgi:hypothetical protein